MALRVKSLTKGAAVGAVALLCAYEALSLAVQLGGWTPPRDVLYEGATVFDKLLFAPNSPVLTAATGHLWEPRARVRWRDVSTNGAGFRGPEVVPRDGGARVAVLGDSLTFGSGVTDEWTWCTALQVLMRQHGIKGQVVNCGVPCQTVVQGVEWYARRVRALEPDVVVVNYGRLDEASPASGGVGDAERVAASKGAAARLARVASRLGLARLAAESLRGDGGGTAGSRPARPRVTPAEYREHLTRLLDEVHADGARVLVVVPPRTAWAESQRPELRELDRIVREAGAGPATAVLEPRDARQGTNGGSAPIGHWYVDESRLSSDGTIRYAEAVGVRLRELRWFEPASR